METEMQIVKRRFFFLLEAARNVAEEPKYLTVKKIIGL